MRNNLEIIYNDINNINIDLSKLKDKSILITGASGLIGIYLLALLKTKQKEYNITIHSWTRNEIKNNIKQLFENCHTIIGDITDYNMFNDLPMFDFIIHASGYGQPIKFLEDKVKTLEINTLSTIKLFEKLKKDGTFLFVSSSEVYNGLEHYNIVETEIGTTNTDNLRSCYIEGKRCGESLCHSYSEQGYNVKIIRLSLTYGPGTQKNDTRVLNSLIEKGINNESIDLLDDGKAIRTYCYVSDVIEMFMNILLYSKERTYNVGGLETFSIFDLSKMIGTILNKEVIVPEINNKLIGSSNIVNVSIEKYLTEFNKKDFVKLNNGLKNTIKWQIKNK